MKFIIEIPDKEIEKTLKSIVVELYGRKYDSKKFSKIMAYIKKRVDREVRDELYDIIKESVMDYLYENE